MAQSSSHPAAVVTVTTPHDVLLGRGAFAINNEGNIRFRSLIRHYQVIYVSTSRRKQKAKIANEVRAAVREQKGRFLRRVETDAELKAAGLAPGVEAWTEADEVTVMQKIKQALREETSTTWGGNDAATLSERAAIPSEDSSKMPEAKRSKTDTSANVLHDPRQLTTERHQPRTMVMEPNLNFRRFLDATLHSRRPEPVLRGHSDMNRLSFVPQQEEPLHSTRQLPAMPAVAPPTLASVNPQLLQLLATQPPPTPEEGQRLIAQLERDRQVTLQRLQQQNEVLAALRRAFDAPATVASTPSFVALEPLPVRVLGMLAGSSSTASTDNHKTNSSSSSSSSSTGTEQQGRS